MIYKTLANFDKTQLIYKVLLTKNIALAPELSEIEQLEKKSPVLFDALYSFFLETIQEPSEYKPVVPLFRSSSKPVVNLYKRVKNDMKDYYLAPLAYYPKSSYSSRNEGSLTGISQYSKPLPIEPNSNRNSEVIYVDPFDEDSKSSKSIITVLKSPFKSLLKK